MYYPTTTLGYGQRLSIWTIGCHRHCRSCSNPELQAPCPEKDVQVNELLQPIRSLVDKIDGVTITGGEPFDQPDDLLSLLTSIRSFGIRDILVYTGYTLNELIELGGSYSTCLQQVGVLIDGVYRDECNDGRSIRGSSNQVIHLLDKGLAERYSDVLQWPRRSEVVNCNGLLISIGIPPKPSSFDNKKI